MSQILSASALGAWLLVAVYYFYQYALRSAPSVMIPQFTESFGITALGVSAIVGVFYYSYAPFSLLAGAALDRFGSKRIIPIGAALVGLGAMLFATGSVAAAQVGRLLQGAGGAFALVGAVYLATKSLPVTLAASFIGITQMFGMAGGAAGKFLVEPLMKQGVRWENFWIGAGIIGLVLCAMLLAFLPREQSTSPGTKALASMWRSLKTVFLNPQSILCGMISGLLFIPTTIFGMTWGVRFLQEARGREYDAAAVLAATVPLGWIIGCPLMGFISDRLGRRKPVILAGSVMLMGVLASILFGDFDVLHGPATGILLGVASGAAMLLYCVAKEANPPELTGSAIGLINFINFAFCALLGPLFGWRLVSVSQGSEAISLADYQDGFRPLLFGVALALFLTCLLNETGPAARTSSYARTGNNANGGLSPNPQPQ